MQSIVFPGNLNPAITGVLTTDKDRRVLRGSIERYETLTALVHEFEQA